MTPSRSVCSRPSLRRALGLTACALVTIIAAGCGGNAPSSASSAAAATGPKGGAGAAAYRFSACMRHHGVANFPDPKVKTSAGGTSVAIGINPSISGQPAFKTAQAACQHILPAPGNGPDGTPAQRRARTQAFIAFAQCLRTHGFPRFPDPDGQGEISSEQINATGINIHLPAFVSAAKGCTSVTHGQITPAQVVRAINGPH